MHSCYIGSLIAASFFMGVDMFRSRRQISANVFGAALIAALTAFATTANAQTCEGLFESSRDVKKESVAAAPLSPMAQELVSRKWEGISDRGFLSSKRDPTGKVAAEVAKEGLIWWYLRVFVVDSIEAAKAHSALEPDPLMQGVYLINKGKTAEETAALIHEPAPDVFRRMLKNEKMYFFKVKEGNAVEVVSPELIEKSIAIDELTWDLNDPEHGAYIISPGWAFPRYRGVIRNEDTLGSKNYARARILARQLIEKGFRITFNRDFVRSLNMVRDQLRLIEGEWKANSLYAGENNENYKMTIESYKAGRAYSVEVWNEKGDLVGGIIGFKDGTMYSPESTFYNSVDYPKISIGFAKIGIVALMDRLLKAGLTWADAGMVTPFTATMKGELILSRDFLEMVSKLPPTADVDMQSDWTP
jgi:Leu/Phe-tRNA-protein transferase